MLTVYARGEYSASGPITGTVSGSRLIFWPLDSDLKQRFAPVAEGVVHGTTITLTYDDVSGRVTAPGMLTTLALQPATVAQYNRRVAKFQSQS
jgi:hypothetical protein